MAGFAVLEMAQTVVKYWKDPKGFVMDGRCSSRIRTPHTFYYRDFFDIAVKWRQLSEVMIYTHSLMFL
jgi:kynureninase